MFTSIDAITHVEEFIEDYVLVRYSLQLRLTKPIEYQQGICERIVRIKYIPIFEEKRFIYF